MSVNWDESYGAEPDYLALAEDISEAYKISRENGHRALNDKFQLLVDADTNSSGAKTKFLRFYQTFMEQVDSPVALKDGKDFFDNKSESLGCDEKHTKRLNKKFKSCFKESVRKQAADLKFKVDEKMRLSSADLKDMGSTVEACKQVNPKLLHTVKVSTLHSAGNCIRRAATKASEQHLDRVAADLVHWHKPSNSSVQVMQSVIEQESDDVYSVLSNVIESCSKQKDKRQSENIDMNGSFKNRMKPLMHRRQIDEAVERATMPPDQMKLYDQLMKVGRELQGKDSYTGVFHRICKQFDQKTVDGLSRRFKEMGPIDWMKLPVPARHCGGFMVQVLTEASHLKTSQARFREFTVPKDIEQLKEKTLEYVKRMESGEPFSASDLKEIKRIVAKVEPKLLGERVDLLRVGTHLRRVAMKAAEDVLRQAEKDVNRFHGAMNSSSASVEEYLVNKTQEIETTLTSIIDKCSKKEEVRRAELRELVGGTEKRAGEIVDGRKLLEALGYDHLPPREVKLFSQLLRVGKGLDPYEMSARVMKFCSREDQTTVNNLLAHLEKADWHGIPAGYQSIRNRGEVILDVLARQSALSRSMSELSLDSGTLDSTPLPLGASRTKSVSNDSLDSSTGLSPKPARKRPGRKAPPPPPRPSAPPPPPPSEAAPSASQALNSGHPPLPAEPGTQMEGLDSTTRFGGDGRVPPPPPAPPAPPPPEEPKIHATKGRDSETQDPEHLKARKNVLEEIRKVGQKKREELEENDAERLKRFDAEKIEGDKMSQSGLSGGFGKVSNMIPAPPIKSDKNGVEDDENEWE
ncbi:hypothetical protein [Endozoicomonas sp. Mp262]|uniref:hypothetical protein n=1 Tax=Endozoicomonas sp. Mp262 TaxID=2919499 RepID=UPI0021DAC34B